MGERWHACSLAGKTMADLTCAWSIFWVNRWHNATGNTSNNWLPPLSDWSTGPPWVKPSDLFLHLSKCGCPNLLPDIPQWPSPSSAGNNGIQSSAPFVVKQMRQCAMCCFACIQLVLTSGHNSWANSANGCPKQIQHWPSRTVYFLLLNTTIVGPSSPLQTYYASKQLATKTILVFSCNGGQSSCQMDWHPILSLFWYRFAPVSYFVAALPLPPIDFIHPCNVALA